MIRVHSFRNSGFVVNVGQQQYSWFYNKGVTAIQLTAVVGSASDIKVNRSCDILDEDLFGENITYDVGAPVSHHWNSIRNFQAKGDLYCISRDQQTHRIGGSTINALTGDNFFFPVVGTIDSSFGYYSEAKVHGIYPDTPNLVHAYFGIGCVAIPDVYPSSKEDRSAYYVTSLARNIYDYHGELSLYPGKLVTSELYGEEVNLCHISQSYPGEPYRLVSLKRRFKIWYLVDVYSGPAEWNTRKREAVELYLSRNPGDQEAWGYISYFGKTALKAVREPVFHMPDYESIFDSRNRNPYWPQLAAEAYQGLAFSDINGIAFVKDAGEFGAACTAFAKTLKSIPSKRVAAAAGAWLSVHYGFKLMLLDTIELRDTLLSQSLRNARKSKCQSSHSYRHGRVSYQARYQVFYNEFDKLLSAVDQVLFISDFRLSLENFWDMVPYSFIIDWFVSIGDILSSIDGYATLTQEHKVIAVGKSIKGTCQCVPTMLGLGDEYVTSGINLTAYFRRYSKSLTRPTLLPSVTVNPFNHLVEGAALVISRK